MKQIGSTRRALFLVASAAVVVVVATGIAFAADRESTNAPVQMPEAPNHVPPSSASSAGTQSTTSATTGEPASSGQPGSASAGSPDPVAKPDQVDVEAFAVLKRAHTANDALPPGQHIAFSASSGANLNLARKVTTSYGVAWVIPGEGAVCLLTEPNADPSAGGAGCADNQAATQGYLEMEEVGTNVPDSSEAPNFVSGLVPDAVQQVAIHLSNGESTDASVRENVYMDEVTGHVSSVTFNGPQGHMTVGP